METLSRRNVSSNCLRFAFALVLVAVGVAWADSGADTFVYLAGFPTDIASAANGDTITIHARGTLSIHPKSVTGGGNFIHKDSTGAVIASGSFTALELLSFDDFGAASPTSPAHGGHALIRVHLSTGVDGILEIDCGINGTGSNAFDAVRLALDGGPNFNDPVSGGTVFLD